MDERYVGRRLKTAFHWQCHKNWKVCLVIKTVHTFTCGVFLLFIATKVKQSFYTCKFSGYFTTPFQQICNLLVAK